MDMASQITTMASQNTTTIITEGGKGKMMNSGRFECGALPRNGWNIKSEKSSIFKIEGLLQKYLERF